MSGVYTKKCAEDVFDDSEGALPFKLQRTAEDELGETPAMREEAVGKLKQLLSGEQCTELRAYGYQPDQPVYSGSAR